MTITNLVKDALLKMQMYLKVNLKATDTVDFVAEDIVVEKCFGRSVSIKVNDDVAFSKKALGPEGVEITDKEALDEILVEQMLVEMIFYSVDAAMRAKEAVKPKSKIITDLR